MAHLRGITPVIAAVVAAGVLVAGCGGSAGHSASATRSPEDQSEFDFVNCMRQHGVQMPDPVHRPGHVGLSLQIPGGPTPQNRQAQQACQHLLRGVIAQKVQMANSPEMLDYSLRFAQCLRDHGVDVPDPTPDRPDPEGVGQAERATPQFQAADQACRHQVPPPTLPGGSGK